MRLTIESTTRIVEVRGGTHTTPVQARVWQGTTDTGIPVVCLVASVAVPVDQDQRAFEADLGKPHAAPSRDAVEAFPLRMVL